jgi:hypothetical protein
MEHHIEGTEFFSKKEAKAKFRQHIFDFWGNKCAYCRESLGRSGTIGSCSPEVQRWRNSAVQSGGLLLRLQYVQGKSSRLAGVVSYTAFLGAPLRGCDQAVAESVITFPGCVDTHAATKQSARYQFVTGGLRGAPAQQGEGCRCCVACQSASALSSLAGSVFSNHHWRIANSSLRCQPGLPKPIRAFLL